MSNKVFFFFEALFNKVLNHYFSAYTYVQDESHKSNIEHPKKNPINSTKDQSKY